MCGSALPAISRCLKARLYGWLPLSDASGIIFLSGCHCLMLNGIFPANLCPMPIGILFAGCLCLLPIASFCFNSSCILFFNRAMLMRGSMQPHSGIGGDEKKPFHGGGDRLLLSELYPCGKAIIYLWNAFLSYLRHSVSLDTESRGSAMLHRLPVFCRPFQDLSSPA